MKIFLYIAGLFLVIISMLYAIGIYLSPEDKLSKADVVVAVSGGDTEARTLKAVEIYNQNYTEKMIFSGDALDPISKSNAQAMKEIAIANNVPAEHIEIEEKSKNTAENAKNTKHLLEEGNHSKLILVTSPYHQRRTFLEFKGNLPTETEIINAPAEDRSWSRNTWFLKPKGVSLTLSEFPKVIFLQTKSFLVK